MFFFSHQLLALAPMSSGSPADLAAMPRPETKKPSAQGRIGVLGLFGLLTPDYLAEFRERCNYLAASDEFSNIVILINSPGGFVEGTPESAEVVRRATARKRVDVVVEDLCASGAYWIASQSRSITATPSANVGCLGVYSVVVDDSEAYLRQGLKVVKVASEPMKGAATPGLPLEADYLDNLQRHVDVTNVMFKADVERGRRLTVNDVDRVFTAEIWHAAIAKTRGLVDRVALVEDRLAELFPRPSEPWGHLTGQAAIKKIDELEEQLAKDDGYTTVYGGKGGERRTDWDAVRSAVAKKHPLLASAAHAAADLK